MADEVSTNVIYKTLCFRKGSRLDDVTCAGLLIRSVINHLHWATMFNRAVFLRWS